MRTRQIELLDILMQNHRVEVSRILELYGISRRTLFYDIEEINYNLLDMGNVKIFNKEVVIELKDDAIEDVMHNQILHPIYHAHERQRILLLSIMEGKERTIEEFAEQLEVSKTTIFTDIENLRMELKSKHIRLMYNKRYYLEGSEKAIRDLYLELLKIKEFSYDRIDVRILKMNQIYGLQLSDYTMFYVSEFIKFIEMRVQSGHIMENVDIYSEAFSYIHLDIRDFIHIDQIEELAYINAYLLSVISVHNEKIAGIVDDYVHNLLTLLRYHLSLDIQESSLLMHNLKNHLCLSYFRIKYKFPVLNPQLKDIKARYFYLFTNTKRIIQDLRIYPFHEMSDEEIGFVVTYIGGYLYEKRLIKEEIRVILVCPQGRAVSHHLRLQFLKLFPSVKIVGTYSIGEISHCNQPFDYVITTVNLPGVDHVIKVNPILHYADVERLRRIFHIEEEKPYQVDELMEIIRKYSIVTNEDKILSGIQDFLDKVELRKGYEPMLHELITKEKIQKVTSVSNWEEAVRLAAKPLLADACIEQSYVQAMIDNVHNFGPYIVLTDEFALAHASSANGVNALGMSLLVLEKPVDLMDRPVRIIVVLATPDNRSHLKALTTLTAIISENEILEKIKEASIEDIYQIMKGELK